MEYSKNLGLNLPDDNDPLEISKLSENFEKLDADIPEMASDAFKVGDTLVTYRTDLGDKWALCNGAAFDPNEYPDFFKNITSWTQSLVQSTTRTFSTANSVAYDGVSRGLRVSQFSTGNTVIYGLWYTDDNFATFRQIDSPPKVSTSSYESPYAVYYVNGYWIIISALGNTWWSIYATTSEEIESGTYNWQGGETTIRAGTSASSSATFGWPSHIEYRDGKYYMFMRWIGTTPSTGPVVVEADNPGFVNYTSHPVVHTTLVTATAWFFARSENYYIYIGKMGTTVTDILYAKDPLGPYSEAQASGEYRAFGAYVSACNDTIFFFTSDKMGYIDDLASGAIKCMTSPGSSTMTASNMFYILGQYYAINTKGLIWRVPALEDGGTFDPDVNIAEDLCGSTTSFAFVLYDGTQKVPISVSDDKVTLFSTNSITELPICRLPTLDNFPAYTYVKVK